MRTLGTNQIEEQICEAIEMIVNKAVTSAKYDRTIRASIVECIDQSIGKYKIKYQDNLFFAYTENIDIKYSKGTEVYVLIHNNDLNMNKTILGSVKKLGSDYITEITPENKYEKIGTNLILNDNNFELCSYISEEKREVDSDLIFLKENEIKEYISNSSHIIIEADIKTSLPQSQRYKGNYGMTFDIDFYASEAEKNSSTPEIVTKTYKLDINNITGEPYALNDFTKQFAVFQITPETFKGIKNISIFEYGFPEEKAGQPNDIFIKNISLYAAVEIPEQDLLSCYLSIATLEGTYFDEQNLATDTKSMKAQVVAKGNIVNNDSQIKYYWFRENAKVSSVDLVKFNKYGGNGWECLNNYNILTSDEQGDPTAIEWIPGSNEYSLRKEELLTTEVKYKCVVLYGEIILSKEVVFKNMDAPYRVSIVSDGGTMFFEGVGSPTLTCLINEQENTKDYNYYWVTLDNNNLLSEVNTNTNKVKDINIRAIMNFVTYKCSVYLATDDSYLGTSSITLTNGELLEENEYTFILNNGVQVFKYDEDGVSPTSTIMENPQVIYPLSFTTYDRAGALIPAEEICAVGNVEWIIPLEDESLLSVPNGYDDGIVTEEGIIFRGYPELNYEIAKRFNSSKTNNNIKLSIEYKGFIYNTETSFSFLKEGDPGTNGTSYYCRIVPNAIQGDEVSYPMINYNQASNSYTLNYSTPIGQENKWFKVQLWENDYMVFEDISNTVATTEKPYEITWSVPKNQYTSSIKDFSDISVVSTTGACSFTKNSNNVIVNIIKCQVDYKGQTFYATLPVVTALNSNANYNIKLKEKTGFNFVRYASNGTEPKYNGSNLFEIILLENNIDITEKNEITYTWDIKGSIYNTTTSTWELQQNLTIPTYSNSDSAKWERVVRPEQPYNGECLSNSIECSAIKNGTKIATLRIPIHMYLNRYGLANLNDWDGNHIDINDAGNYILSPQIGAGSKNESNQFTGIVMGEVRESGKSGTDIGLLGYAQGIRSIFLDAETGKAEFGTTAKIVIDPSEGIATISSDNFKTGTNGQGMMINLSEPSITFGSGGFKVDSSGHMTAKGGGNIAGWTISDDTLTGNQVGIKSKENTSNSEIAFWAGSNTPTNADFRVTFGGKLYADDAEITGSITADDGEIGNFTIEGDHLYSGSHNSFSSTASGIYLGKNGISLGDSFYVDDDGYLTVENATINGDIVGTSSTFYLAEDSSEGMLFKGNVGSSEIQLAYFTYYYAPSTTPEFIIKSPSSSNISFSGFEKIKIGDSNTGEIALTGDKLTWNGEDLAIARFG